MPHSIQTFPQSSLHNNNANYLLYEPNPSFVQTRIQTELPIRETKRLCSLALAHLSQVVCLTLPLETPQNKLFCSHSIVLGQQSKSKSISTLYNKRSDGGILVGVCYHDYGWVSDKLFRVCSRLSKKVLRPIWCGAEPLATSSLALLLRDLKSSLRSL